MEQIKHIDWLSFTDKLIVPACVLIFALFVGIAINGMLKDRIKERVAIDDESKIKSIFFNALHGLPISMSLIIALYWIVSTSEYLPAGISKIFSYLLFTVIVFTLTRVIERTLSGFIIWKMGSTSEVSQSSLLNTIFRIFIYASSALIILQYYGISIAPIITAMGVGGMAIAFGVQETVANIFSGLHLLLTKQVQINDYIKLSSGAEGRVSDINFRFTTVTPANDGSVIVIPNKTIAGEVMTNYSRPRDDIVIVVPIGVSYDSDLEHVEKVTVDVAKKIMAAVDGYEPMIDSNGKDINPLSPVVRYQAFGDSSIDFQAILHATNFKNQFLIKHEFIKAISKRYREEGIDIPFPIRTVLMPDENKNVEQVVSLAKK